MDYIGCRCYIDIRAEGMSRGFAFYDVARRNQHARGLRAICGRESAKLDCLQARARWTT